jgi:hypothetical protein
MALLEKSAKTDAAKQNANKKIKIPNKKTLNFALVGQKKINPLVAIIGIIVIIIAAVLFSKFAVFDRLDKVAKAQLEVSQLRSQISELYAKIAGYGDLNDLYAHYTYNDMSEEELNRADRITAIEMLEKLVEPDAVLVSMSFKGNTLTATVTAPTLQVINVISGQINLEDSVDYCTVNVATRDNDKEEEIKEVKATIIVYLKKALEEVPDENTES